jgi:hypothetical protein
MRQLTHGDGFCYPLYYFIPTATENGATILFHRWADGEIQIYRVDVESGQARRLTNAQNSGAPWRRWMCVDATGVRDQLSAFNVVTRELIYFAGAEIRGVQIDSLVDRLIYTLPADREGSGQCGVSPDGKYLVFAHMAREYFDNAPRGIPNRADARGGIIQLVELATGASRQLLCIHAWITHVHFQDELRIVFCHPPTENGILVADINGNWYTHIRTMDGPLNDGPLKHETTSHYQSTSQGIAYEMRTRVGLCDAYTFACQEYSVADYPVTHIGRDPHARLWFFDSKRPDPQTGEHTGPRCILFLPELKFDAPNKPILLMSGTSTFSEGQHSHVHPTLMPDRKNILCVIGDERSQSNHLCLVDVSDLADTWRETRN